MTQAQTLPRDPKPLAPRRDRLSGIGGPRVSQIPVAMRHTQRVARLRRGIVWGVGGIVAVCSLFLAYHFISHLAVDLRFAGIGFQGARITIDQPRLVGYQKDGRAYELKARFGVQDIHKPDIFELQGLEARLDTDKGRPVLLTSDAAVYDGKQDRAELSNGVRISDEKNYDLRLESATMDFKASTLNSKQPATLKLECCDVDGKSVELAQGESRMTFTGAVHSVFHGDAGSP
ncbi:MAG: LPS export ABC transporter periplasmic protein LptC [Methylocystis sp.]